MKVTPSPLFRGVHVITGLTLFTIVVGQACLAAAAPCGQSNNEQFFVDAAQSNGSTSYVFQHGALGRSQAYNNDLDGGCVGSGQGGSGSLVVKTIHLSPRIACKQIEIGTMQVWKATANPSIQALSEKNWYIFTERIGSDCTDVQDLTFQPTNNVDVGTDDILRISGTDLGDGTTNWSLAVNFVIGAGYVNLGSSPYNSAWNTAISQAEDERFGSGAGMLGNFTALQHKHANGSWVDWPGQTCETHVQNLGNPYDYDRHSATSFDIDHAGATSCP